MPTDIHKWIDKILKYMNPRVDVRCFIVIVLICSLVCIWINSYCTQKSGKKTKYQLTVLLAGYTFFVYLSTVLYRTSNDNIVTRIMPFWSIYEIVQHYEYQILIAVILNILVFVPIGWILYWLLEPGKRFLRCTIISFVISYTIEFSQFFLKRSIFELFDDPIYNLCGTYIGLIISMGCYRILNTIKHHGVQP